MLREQEGENEEVLGQTLDLCTLSAVFFLLFTKSPELNRGVCKQLSGDHGDGLEWLDVMDQAFFEGKLGFS